MRIFFIILVISFIGFPIFSQEETGSPVETPIQAEVEQSSDEETDDDGIFGEPDFYVANVFGFGEWNNLGSESSTMQNLKNDIQAGVTLPFNFSDLYSLKVSLANRFRIYANFKRNPSEFDEGIIVPVPFSVDLRNRLYFDLNNSFKIMEAVNVDVGLGIRFDSHASSHTDDALTGRPRDLSPRLLFYPFMSLYGKVENFSYSLYNFNAFYFNTGDREAFRFRDEVEINLNLNLSYDFMPMIKADDNYKLALTFFMESYTYVTKGDNRSQANKDKDALGFSNFDADLFLLVDAKVKYFQPIAGLFIKTKNGTRVVDQYVSDVYVGGSVGGLINFKNFTFGVNYKAGQQVNPGSVMNYVPNKFIAETAVYFGYSFNNSNPIEKLLVNQ